MSKKWKPEIKGILLIGVCSLALTTFALSEFKNYNWTLGIEHSKMFWILWIFFTIIGLVGGVFYGTRMLLNKEYNGLKEYLSIIFLTMSVIGTFGIVRVGNGLDKYLLPTSEKTEAGFTIYPPLSADAEHWQQLNVLMGHANTVNGLIIFLIILLIMTILLTWKRQKNSA